MDAEQYRIMYEAESVHWWYRGMRQAALELLARYLAPGRTYELLDAGCGTGGTTQHLRRFGVVTGVDFSGKALRYASKRDLHRLVRASIESLPFAEGSFDAVTTFDVVYHRAVGDDRVALSELHRVLRPGGIVLIREPAFDWLRGAHDVGIHTQRRFTVGHLAERLRQAGFEVRHASYANMLLFPLAVAKRTAERFLPTAPADLSVPAAPLNLAFQAVLALERILARRVSLPVGLSAVVVGQRP
ncbi:MAG TPA: class I SAM-dependent methyltransferase [Gemmatimonadales bacterium]|jgi:SAM-dependent methyltransferase|nr:class I SAM-dependent methyltransferase [Gemmatimonadales bacterium]